MSVHGKEWKNKIHVQHQAESKPLDTNSRYDNSDTTVKAKRYGTKKPGKAKN